jgi:hypothetical protein
MKIPVRSGSLAAKFTSPLMLLLPIRFRVTESSFTYWPVS